MANVVMDVMNMIDQELFDIHLDKQPQVDDNYIS
jgi:hypothetical protein